MTKILPKALARASALFLFTALGAIAHAASLPQGVTQGPSVEGVTQYMLANGLKVLLAPDPSKPSTTVNMTYLVGARQENYGQTGMAHLLEHMLFRGTPTTPNALAEFSRRGLAANGSTTSDRTNYYASFAADPETLDWFLGWQADAMVNSVISKKDLDSEMTVVRNEMERGENNPFQILLQKMQATAYQWHNYGHSTIGARSDVENVDIKQLQAYYREYYQPDNAVLIITGRFDPDATLKTVADAFGKIPKPSRTLPPEYTVEPVQDGERAVSLRRHGGTPIVAALYHAPAAGSDDFTALDLGVSILADTPSGPLYHNLVRENLAASVFGFSADMKQPGYVFFGAQLENGMDQDKALSVLEQTVESVGKHPFTDQQLERVRNQWLTEWSQIYANPAQLASALSEMVADGDWRLFFLARDRITNMKLDDVQRVTAAYLTASNRTSGRYIPTAHPVRAPKATQPDLASMLKDYKGKQSTGPVTAAFDVSPENIDAATDRTPLMLPNGEVKLALLPKPTRGNRVHANLRIQFGTADTLMGEREVATAVAALLDHGTTSMSRQEIQDKYNALQAQVGFGGGGGVLTVSMSTVRENLPALLDLVLHVVREADFPTRELVEYQRQAAAAISSAMSEPTSLASRALARHDNPWPREDVRYTPTFQEERDEIAALTRQSLEKFHAKFYGAGNILFSAVGDFDAEAVKKALTQGLKGWQEAPAYERVDNPFHVVPPERFDIDTPDKANAFYLTTAPLELQDTDPDFPALYLANYLLGSSETSRLWNRIRVQDGLSYDVRSQLSASAYEPSGSWTIYAIHAPENSKKLIADVDEVLQNVLSKGFTEQEVREGAQALLNYRKLARARDGTLAAAWISYLDTGRTFAWSQKIDDALRKLNADTINTTLGRWLKPKQFSAALAADKSKWNAAPKRLDAEPAAQEPRKDTPQADIPAINATAEQSHAPASPPSAKTRGATAGDAGTGSKASVAPQTNKAKDTSEQASAAAG